MKPDPSHPRRAPKPGQEWFQSAVIYEVDVKNFRDSNGDGIGDFRGLLDGLDYICSLGVACVWLQPFYASPRRDNGYDVSNYRSVDPDLGTMDDFEAFVAAAQKRGLRVIADLPLNHTSDQHEWFQASRSDRGSAFRDYYLWRDKLPENPAPYPVFGPEQGGNWEWDDVAKQYYFHTFYRFMPDLNIGNEVVRNELIDTAKFWIRHGLHGFRLDAVPFLIQDRADGETLEHPHDFLKQLHAAVDEICPDAVLVAEANLKPHDMKRFFGDGDGDEMHLLLNFYLCNHLFLSLATGESRHIERGWNELPDIPLSCNWANFVRNHDELSLDQITKAEREKVFAAFGPDENMQLYDRGIRRRLAPMLDGDQRRIRLTYSLLLSLPGTPVINLGEEIGLGDDLSLKDRECARTPMQWSGHEPNGGFSSAPREQLVRPVVNDGPFSFERVNVADQDGDPGSLLNFFRRAIGRYNATPPFGLGKWDFLKTGEPAVLAHSCACPDDRIFAIANLSDRPVTVRLDLPDDMVEELSDAPYDRTPAGKNASVELHPYGFRWLHERAPDRT